MRFAFLIILYCTWSCVVVKAASNDVCNLPDGNVTFLPGSCNFNNGHCGYDFPDNLWDTYTESFGSVIYGAITGDNTGSSQTFALFQSNDPSFNDTIVTNSSILSTEVYYTNTPICLKFWYLMPNQNSKLYVYLIDSGTNISTVLFDHSYSSISQWKEVKIPLTVSTNFKVEFQSERENAYGYVGVDNVQFVIETPPATTTASTTTTTSTSTTITTTISTKEATTSTTAPQTTEPTTQSTTLSTTTPTAATTTNTPRYTTRTTTMTTTTTPLETTTMAEPTTEIITTTESLTTEPTTTKMTTQLLTTRERTELPTTDCVCNCPTVSTVCAESLNTLTTPSSVFTVCNLPSERLSVLNQYSCNFDHDMCGYILSSYPHLWEMTSHHYGNGNVGEIIGDHSKGSLSGYMVFNTYNNHVQNNTSHNFRSPLLLPFTQYCASFWYNMPNNASVLEVHVEFQNGTRELLWQQKGTPTNGWVQEKIPLLEESSFSLIFSSTKMTSLSFVGVDDIRISIENPNITMATGRKRRSLASILGSTSLDEDTPRCPCTCPPYHVINCKTTIRPIPPYEQSCSDLMNAVYVKEGSCDFDDGTSCSYNLPVYPHLWDLVQYQYGNQSTGIIDGDLSGGRNGVYLAFTTDDLHVPFGMTSNFRSGTLPEVGNLCLSFWYNLPTNSASLNVYKETGDKQELLWKMENQKSAGWQRATILFKADQNMKIDFVSSKTSLDAYFGLDEIQLYRNATM